MKKNILLTRSVRVLVGIALTLYVAGRFNEWHTDTGAARSPIEALYKVTR